MGQEWRGVWGKRLERWFRMSLRAQGVLVLAVPIAALFSVLFSIYSVEATVGSAEQAVEHASEVRMQLGLLESALRAQSDAVAQTLVGLDSLLTADTEGRQLFFQLKGL